MLISIIILILLIALVSAQSNTCPPGYYGINCEAECTACGQITSGSISYYNCADGPTGNGYCLSCPKPATQFGPHCTNCLTGILDIFDAPQPVTGDYCSTQFPDSTCGNNVDITTVCQCNDNTKQFINPNPSLYNLNNVNAQGYIVIDVIDSKGLPAASTYCCINASTCSPGTFGCNCQFSCATPGCQTCGFFPTTEFDSSGNYVIQPAAVCSSCQVEYYPGFAGPDLTYQANLGGGGTIPFTIPNSNLICTACSVGCRVCQVGIDSNCTNNRACNATECHNQCISGYYGAQCNEKCKCVTGSVCDDGKTGSGNCTCTILGQVLSEAYGICIIPNCGLDRINLCSGNGLCDQTFSTGVGYNEYCLCNPGWNGTDCSIPYTGYDECDCGVLWDSPYQSSLGALPNMVAVQDMPYVTLLGNGLNVPVGTPAQAQWLCYQDFFCDLFVLWSSPFYGLFTGQADVFPSPVLLASFFQLGGSSRPVGLPVGITFTVYTIERTTYNNCSDSTLDVTYYSDQNTPVVVDYCQQIQSADQVPIPCDNSQIAQSLQYFTYVNYWFLRHWRYVGQQERLNPNDLCQMQPAVFNPLTYCSTSRCLSLSGIGPPCILEGQISGYCEVNPSNPTGFQCSCLQFFEQEDTGTDSLNYQPAFIGLGCEFPVSTFCAESNAHILCNGVVGGCQSMREWNGSFFLENFQQFETVLFNDYVPFCNCEGSGFTGQFCQTSLCPDACNAVSEQGTCVNAGNNTWVCECNDGWLGTSCEIDASICLFSSQINCNGNGACVLNGTTPQCECNVGFLGQQCQDWYCPPTEMTPGHGTCVLNSQGVLVPATCYPPYVGNACQVDSCARYYGTVIGNPPSGCNCSTQEPLPCGQTIANLLNGAVTPGCWPQCPTLNNVTCGVLGAGVCFQQEFTLGAISSQAVCIPIGQLSESFVRQAQCSCALGYIWNDITGLCDAFCAHGVVPQGWTVQNQLPCICSPSTGFDINNGLNLRCDHSVCNNQGTYNGSQCICIPPYNSFTNCLTSFCTIAQPTATVIPWLQGSSAFKCNCPVPSAPSDPLNPYDCSGSVCGNHGLPNFNYGGVTENACFCEGLFRTACNTTANTTACAYCQSSFCQSGGYPNPNDINICNCGFPFTGSNCQDNQCVHGLASATINACVCNSGFMGLLCDEPACQHGTFTNNTCVCSSGYTGSLCDSSTTPGLVYDPATGKILGLSPSSTIITTSTPAPISQNQATAIIAASVVAAVGGIAVAVYVVYYQFNKLATVAEKELKGLI